MNEKKIQIGGQAVIEGVMMRGPEHIATAIRRKDGCIEVQKKPFISITKSHPIYKLPVFRGFVSLIEMLKIGIQTLNHSASVWELDNSENTNTTAKSSTKDKIGEYLTIGISIALALLLFGFVPYLLTNLIGLEKQSILYNLFAGSLRIVFFVIYVFSISFLKDIKRVFQYHGAEHKAVFAYENKAELTVDSVRNFSTIHPRCGTSFMFFVLLIAILVFSCIDTLVIYYELFTLTPVIRFLYHLPFIPLISGISYEFLKISEKKMNNFFIRIFTKPGMALQKITTQEPDDQQIEVAIVALKQALNEN